MLVLKRQVYGRGAWASLGSCLEGFEHLVAELQQFL